MKKGITPEILTAIIALSTVLIIMLTVLVPPLAKQIFGRGEEGLCRFDLLLNSLAKQGTLGFKDLPIECKAKYRTITLEELERNKINAQGNITQFNTRYPEDTTYAGERGPYVWTLQEIYAKEMVNCYNRVARGGLDFESFIENRFCIVCARIRLDQAALNSKIPDFIADYGKEYPLKPILNVLSDSQKTYYDILTGDITNSGIKKLVENSKIGTYPMAVTFVYSGSTGFIEVRSYEYLQSRVECERHLIA